MQIGEFAVCERCGSQSNVAPVTYRRGDWLLSQHWCQSCKEQRLTRARPAPRRERPEPVVALVLVALVFLAVTLILAAAYVG